MSNNLHLSAYCSQRTVWSFQCIEQFNKLRSQNIKHPVLLGYLGDGQNVINWVGHWDIISGY